MTTAPPIVLHGLELLPCYRPAEKLAEHGIEFSSLEEFRGNMRRFLGTDDGQELVMLNLNVYRDAPLLFSQDVDHKWAALSRSTGMATVPALSFATNRLAPFLVQIVIGLLLDRIGARSRNPQPPNPE